LNQTFRFISGESLSSSLFEIGYSQIVDLGGVVDRVLQTKHNLPDVPRHDAVSRVVEVHVQMEFHDWDEVVHDLLFLENIEDFEDSFDGCKSHEDLEVI
jgi:hypothetical protein